MFFPKEKRKNVEKQKDDVNRGRENMEVKLAEAGPSSTTQQKVAAAKQYIENHYKEQMKTLQERRERYDVLIALTVAWIQ